MISKTPSGITPPAPGLDHEEPDFWVEDDIPTDDSSSAPPRAEAREEGTAGRSDRE